MNVVSVLILAGVLGGGFYWVELRPWSIARRFLTTKLAVGVPGGFANLQQVTGLTFLASPGAINIRDFYFTANDPIGRLTFFGVKIDVVNGRILQSCSSLTGTVCDAAIPI